MSATNLAPVILRAVNQIQFPNPYAAPQCGDEAPEMIDATPFRSAIILLWILAGFTLGVLLLLAVFVLAATPGGLRISRELATSILLWGGFAGGAAGAAWARRRVARIDDRADVAAANRRAMESVVEAARGDHRDVEEDGRS